MVCVHRRRISHQTPFFDVKFARDSDSVVSVLVKKFVKEKLVDEKSFLAIYYEGYYYAVPKSLARHEGLYTGYGAIPRCVVTPF